MPNLRAEQAITLKQAQSLFRCRPASRTLRTWITVGLLVNRRSARRVVLETFREGGSRMTTVEAVDRFCRRLNRKG